MIKIYVPETTMTDSELGKIIKINPTQIISQKELLHPMDQVKKAEELVKEHESLYVFTHSAMFLEAFEKYCELYEREIKYYFVTKNGILIQKKGKQGMIDLYDCLGDPYDILDALFGKLEAIKLKKNR